MRRRHLRKKVHEDAASAPEPRPRSGANTGILSFDVEEEPVIVPLKKRNEKRRSVAEMQLKSADGATQPPPQLTSVGAYTAEKLAALKAATVGTRSKGVPSEPVLKVTGSFKPASTPRQEPEAFIRVDPEPQLKTVQRVPEADPDDHFSPPNSQTIEYAHCCRQGCGEAANRLAKAKREMLRQAQLAPDYLPLGGASSLLRQDVEQTEQPPSSESDAEEDHMRLQFIGHRSNKAKVVDEEMDLDRMEDEDAVDSFVDAQIKKGITALGLTNTRTKPTSKSKPHAQVEDEICVLPVVSRESLAAEAELAWNALLNGTSQLQRRQEQSLENLRRTKNRLAEAEKGMEQNKTETESAEGRYKEVQEMREYIGDLCDCLQEKLPFIEAMEDHVQELCDASAQCLEEESLMEKEGLELAEIASNAILESIAAEESLDQAASVAQMAVEELEITFLTTDDPEMHQRAVQRGEKRKRRWKAASGSDSFEKWDPVGSEHPSWSTQVVEMTQTSRQIFSDVVPEMSSISDVIAQFAQWKAQFPKLYEMAYLPESLSALLAPFVRSELVSWSPLYGSELGLDSQSWYQAVEQFGDEKEEHLVPELVKQVVLPAARRQIQKCWSPFSSHAAHTVAEMTRELLVYVPMEDNSMQELLHMVQEKLSSAVGDAGIPPFTRPALMGSTVVQSVVAVRFRRALCLIESFGHFGDILPIAVLRNLLMRELVCEKLLPYIRTATFQPRDAVQKIVELLKRIPLSVMTSPLAALERMQISELVNAMSRAVEKRGGVFEESDEASIVRPFIEWLRFFKRDDRATAVEKSCL